MCINKSQPFQTITKYLDSFCNISKDNFIGQNPLIGDYRFYLFNELLSFFRKDP